MAPLWGSVTWGAFPWTAAGTTTTSFLHDGDNEIAEYDGSGALIRRFVPGPAVDQPIAMVAAAGTRTYVHANRQGSVVTMSNASGAPAEGPYVYDAYGTCMTAAGSPCAVPTTATMPFRYTGRYLDAETGLYYYRARYYSSAHGRFLQTDPVGYKDDFNLYAYVGNDPTNGSDPTGSQVITNADGVPLADQCPGGVGYCGSGGLNSPHPSYKTITLQGAGSVVVGEGRATGGGLYTIIDPSGKVVETGRISTDTQAIGLDLSGGVEVSVTLSQSMPALNSSSVFAHIEVVGAGMGADEEGGSVSGEAGVSPTPFSGTMGKETTTLIPLTGPRAKH